MMLFYYYWYIYYFDTDPRFYTVMTFFPNLPDSTCQELFAGYHHISIATEAFQDYANACFILHGSVGFGMPK